MISIDQLISELPLDLLSDDKETRRQAARAIGRAGEHLDLLEAVASRGLSRDDPEITRETLTAAFWLAYHDESSHWSGALAEMAGAADDEIMRELAWSLHGIVARHRQSR